MKKFIPFVIVFLFTSINRGQTQYPPISPKWVFEPWVWEDATNTETSTWSLINGYLDNNIPTSAVILDSPWEQPIASGYNTFYIDPGSYPNPKSFIQQLNNKGIHVILWITGCMSTDCPLYNDALKAGYFVNGGATTYFWKGTTNLASHIDFFNPAAVEYWEGLMDRVFDSLSVDGWKVDESDNELPATSLISTYQGLKTRRQYSDAYYSEMYNYIHKKRGDQAMIMARPYCKETDPPDYTPYYFAPISVNTAGWVGDKYSTWDGLTLMLNNIFLSANAGYAAVGSDIGGYKDNTTSQNKNLFIRWAQLGSLMPIMENGGKTDDHHQPWLFDNNTVQIYKYFAELHHELVPYLYSYDILAHLTKTPIIRPFGNRDNSDTTVWDGDWRYLLGDNLFVTAIYQDDNSRQITFPDGESWIDYWNDNNIYQGGTTTTISYSLDQYPLFIKSGAIIPLNVDNSVTGHGSEASSNYLTLLVYPNGLSSYRYYTDQSTYTTITCSEQCGGYSINFSKNTGSVIIRLKSNIEPESVSIGGGQLLAQVNSFTDLESAQSGWFYGKVSSGENVYTWIKFTSSTNGVYITTSHVSDINPTNYVVSKLAVGNEYYVDRNYTLTNVPAEYNGYYMIKTANDDKTNTSSDFHFNACSDMDIYVAYDHRLASSTPSWITNNYTSTGETILGNDNSSELTTFDIWKRTNVPAGTISFGPNNGIQESSMYFVFYKSYGVLSVSAKVFLQGPYNGTDMNTNLNTLGDIPLSQPYNVVPWNYNGIEKVSSVPSGVVDWVLVQLRTATGGASTATHVVQTRAALLMSDGSIHDVDGSGYINFVGVTPGDYYIVIEHRNHLAVISSAPVPLPNTSSSTYDFTNASNVYGGTNAMANLGGSPAVYGMYTGDANGDGAVTGTDFNIFSPKFVNGSPGYDKADWNLDGNVTGTDFNFFSPNFVNGKISYVPK